MNDYIRNWEENRQAEIKQLTDKGTIPVEHDMEHIPEDLADEDADKLMEEARPFLMGKASAVVNERKSAKAIVDEMVNEACDWMKTGSGYVAKL